jgi:hypothetical protein
MAYVIGFLFLGFWVLVFFGWRRQRKQERAESDQRERMSSYNTKCVGVKLSYKNGELTDDQAWRKLEEFGDKYGIPEDRRTRSLHGVWMGTTDDGSVWAVRDGPGQKKVPRRR